MSNNVGRAATEYDPWSTDDDAESREQQRQRLATVREHQRWSLEHSKVAHLDRGNEPTWVRLPKE